MKWRHIVRQIARILSILLVLFFLMFSFDEPILSLGFLMHTIPTIIILVAAIIAWKFPLQGGIAYLILGILTIFTFNVRQHPQALFLTLPFLLIGALSLASSYEHHIKTKTSESNPTDSRA